MLISSPCPQCCCCPQVLFGGRGSRSRRRGRAAPWPGTGSRHRRWPRPEVDDIIAGHGDHVVITCAPHMYPLHKGTMSHTIRVTLEGMMPLNMDDTSPRGVQWSLPSDRGTICSVQHFSYICRECGHFYLMTDTFKSQSIFIFLIHRALLQV